nr:transglutaminase family protein [Hydrococcus rivularis]
MEVGRAIGLAARFVSGYQEGDLDKEERDLHAWVEVYLPGAGWRGYDPTHGLAVGDRHIALVASALPAYASPIVGATTPVKSYHFGFWMKGFWIGKPFLRLNCVNSSVAFLFQIGVSY